LQDLSKRNNAVLQFQKQNIVSWVLLMCENVLTERLLSFTMLSFTTVTCMCCFCYLKLFSIQIIGTYL